MQKDDRSDSILIYLLLIFLFIFIIWIVFEQKILSDGFSKRQPLKNYKYISEEIKKLPEGKNIYLENVYLQGQLLLDFQYKIEISRADLLQLSIEISKIVDKYLLLEERQSKVSVNISCPNSVGMSCIRIKADRNSEDYYWWIDGKKYGSSLL